MLPQKNRIQNKKDIDRVLKKGKGLKEKFLILETIKNDLNKTRFAFIVSKKISLKASTRNKIKRKLSEIVRLKLKIIKPGQDILLIASPGLEMKDFWEIEEMINELFKKAKLVQ